jgi:diguanylate cyclase (GGDEF)-like protein
MTPPANNTAVQQRRSLKVLIVEDSENDTLLIIRELRKGGYDPDYRRVEAVGDLSVQLESEHWDLVITDHNLPGLTSVEALRVVKGSAQDIPVIIVSGAIGEEFAAEAMRAGAHDYVMKDNLSRLVPAIERELRDARIRQEKNQAERALSHLTQHDSLTNLTNRTALVNLLTGALSAAQLRKTSLALLYIDLDRFKVINDTYGFEIGDKVLQEVARRLRHCARYDDTLARYGSDEFILIIENISGPEEAVVLAGMVINQLSQPYVVEEQDIHIRASIGVALSDDSGYQAEELIHNADAAMYQAKSVGRNNYQLYSPALNERAEHRRYLELSLHRAMESNELTLHYQPQVDLKSGRLRGAEVLLRWNHSTLGLISPDEFIDLLEETGLIIPVGEWVFRTAGQLWQQWIERGELPYDAILSINISSRQFTDGLVDMVARVINDVGIPAELVDLEITEGTLMGNTRESERALLALKNLGVKLSIDDFGVGYSSLSYLTRFPVDCLKIDKSFIIGMNENKNNAVIARAIIGLAESLGLKVIAEGVENREAASFLLEHGCHLHQGFLYSRPMPPEIFIQKINSLFLASKD